MEKHPWFVDWFNSPYYHQLYSQRDLNEAATCADKLIEHLSPKPDALMLDVACGRGRHAIQLAKKGFDVTGFDLSETSIREALKYQTEKLHFYRHDMRLPFWINYFDYAFNFFTSFGYFKTSREHDNAIRTISQALNSTGCFVMDYLNTQYIEDHLIPQSTIEINSITFNINKWCNDDHFYKKIIINDKQLKEPLEFTEEVARFTLQDFIELFAKQNLHIQEVFGDYDLSSYDVKNSPRLIMIARKK